MSLSSAAWPSMPKKHFNVLINHNHEHTESFEYRTSWMINGIIYITNFYLSPECSGFKRLGFANSACLVLTAEKREREGQYRYSYEINRSMPSTSVTNHLNNAAECQTKLSHQHCHS